MQKILLQKHLVNSKINAIFVAQSSIYSSKTVLTIKNKVMK